MIGEHDILPPGSDDPRHRNERLENGSMGAFLADYAERLGDALRVVDAVSLARACTLIEEASHSGKRVYAIGNGGSAAIADHLCCDWTKGTHAINHPVIDSTSLVANGALYSAIANDFGFEQVFSRQIGFFGKPGDVLIAISSSGNSPNIVNAIEAARSMGMVSIGLSGFAGGRLADLADVSLHVAVNNYGIVEDAHQALMHVIAQYIACDRDDRR